MRGEDEDGYGGLFLFFFFVLLFFFSFSLFGHITVHLNFPCGFEKCLFVFFLVAVTTRPILQTHLEFRPWLLQKFNRHPGT